MVGTDQIGQLVNILKSMVAGGKTPGQAAKELANLMPVAAVEAARTEFERQAGLIRTLREPASLEREDLQSWYAGPQPGDLCWTALRQHLQDKGWSDRALKSLDDASTKVVALLPVPGSAGFSARGLVLGYIQSGKTANYTAVIAKAADAGFKFFIVLSGLHNLLRSQTQGRLERELYDLNTEHWVKLTDREHDFRLSAGGNADAFLTTNAQHRVLCIVKKNAAILRKLLKWLRSARTDVRRSCPVLVIDDEADQASVNASGTIEDRTKVNQLILDILSELPKVGYVGYTATPFANIFIDPTIPQDLYPRDFIIDLPRPPDYYGPERIFGRERLTPDDPDEAFDGLDVIRRVPDAEVPLLKPAKQSQYPTFEPELTPSLRTAIQYFWLATAVRFARGQSHEHSTMLIHTTLYAAVHERFRPLVESLRDRTRFALQQQDPEVLKQLRTLWEGEWQRVPTSEFDTVAVDFDDILPHLDAVLERTSVVIENSRSTLRLEYPDAGPGRVVVVIGGNTLSRGLTLEGLVVSFFVRAASAYDTLLQMGRWFGFRPGYADLPRIWMTEELEQEFFELATVEAEMRNDIERYELEGVTPLEFGPRIRTHPKLAITSELKMGAAVDCDVSYSDRRVQTILFYNRSREWLTQNQSATWWLLKRAAEEVGDPERGPGQVLFRGVSVRHVLQFLEDYNFHPRSQELRSVLLCGYIDAQVREGSLGRWNVGVITRSSATGIESFEIGPGINIPLLNRSRLKFGPDDYANLGVIMSNVDIVADLTVEREVAARSKPAALQAMRPAGLGLILLYPISRASRPRQDDDPGARRSRRPRAPLDALEHLIGVGLVFPRAVKPTPQRYVTVDLTGVEREEPELPQDEDEEE